MRKNLSKQYKQARGFTLIELLVSVAIVGILASIGISAFEEYRAKVYDTTSIVFQRELQLATELFISEFDNVDRAIVSWLHRADGTNSFANGGQVFQEYVNVPSDSRLFFYVRVDTRCLLGSCPTGDEISYGNAGHCLSVPKSSTTVKYNTYVSKVNGTVTTGYYYPSKASRGCS